MTSQCHLDLKVHAPNRDIDLTAKRKKTYTFVLMGHRRASKKNPALIVDDILEQPVLTHHYNTFKCTAHWNTSRAHHVIFACR